MSIYVLKTGDKIKTVSGENVNFFGHIVVGKLNITTINGHHYGTFGWSGHARYLNEFDCSLNDLKLGVENGQYVAAIGVDNSPVEFSDSNSLRSNSPDFMHSEYLLGEYL